MILLFLVLTPLVAALLIEIVSSKTIILLLHFLSMAITLSLGITAVVGVWREGNVSFASFRVDALSAFMLMLVCGVGTISAIYAVRYINEEERRHTLSFAKVKHFYALLHLFFFAMFMALTTDNLGILWIAVEGTSLATVFLVNLHDTRSSLEAAYKYLMISSLGIALAFIGTIILAMAGGSVVGPDNALNWTALHAADGTLGGPAIRLAFIFGLIGYGTKAGLAPMHTWLPDAHSEAPAPVSALMSGVLLNIGFYAILRFKMLADNALGITFSRNILLGLGLLSVGVAACFLLYQKDYKRMLAYSSVEHMGIICLGIAFGGYWGVFGAFLHMINHAMGKSLLFLSSGDIILTYHSAKINEVRGLLRALPLIGGMFLLGTFALIGLPPFGLFISEFLIFRAGLSGDTAWVAGMGIVFLVISFAGMLNSINQMFHGQLSENLTPIKKGGWALAPMAVNISVLLLLGLTLPAALNEILTRIFHILEG